MFTATSFRQEGAGNRGLHCMFGPPTSSSCLRHPSGRRLPESEACSVYGPTPSSCLHPSGRRVPESEACSVCFVRLRHCVPNFKHCPTTAFLQGAGKRGIDCAKLQALVYDILPPTKEQKGPGKRGLDCDCVPHSPATGRA